MRLRRHGIGWLLRRTLTGVALALGCSACDEASSTAEEEAAPERALPNIVVIMADDLGYGDAGCYGADLVETPHIDRIATEGILFTDAHAPSPTCTPTRYSLLTGRYFWRARESGWIDTRELLIERDRVTLASLLASAGYATGCVGKWHLGFGEERPNWNGVLRPGPLEVGFDYYFGTPNGYGEAPYVFVENHRVVGLKRRDPIDIDQYGYRSHGKMKGGNSARFVGREVGRQTTERAVAFMERNRERPFFLLFTPDKIHTPLSPSHVQERFLETSKCGLYGDHIHELDWSVGEVLAALDRLELTQDTLLIFTSDNGAMHNRAAFELGHRATGPLSGQKTDLWEGGHRVPFLARWPGKIAAGRRSDELLCLTDVLATVAAVVGKELPPDAGPDSFDALPALLDQPDRPPIRESMLMGWPGGAVRVGPWLLVLGQGSIGRTASSKPPPGPLFMTFTDLGHQNSDFEADGTLKPGAPPEQLYDLNADLGQTTNLYDSHPDVVERLRPLWNASEEDLRTRP